MLRRQSVFQALVPGRQPSQQVLKLNALCDTHQSDSKTGRERPWPLYNFYNNPEAGMNQFSTGP
jgi:hypothetical protein